MTPDELAEAAGCKFAQLRMQLLKGLGRRSKYTNVSAQPKGGYAVHVHLSARLHGPYVLTIAPGLGVSFEKPEDAALLADIYTIMLFGELWVRAHEPTDGLGLQSIARPGCFVASTMLW